MLAYIYMLAYNDFNKSRMAVQDLEAVTKLPKQQLSGA